MTQQQLQFAAAASSSSSSSSRCQHKPRQQHGSCKITFADVPHLQHQPEAAQQILAQTVLAGMQLLTNSQQTQHQTSSPFAWISGPQQQQQQPLLLQSSPSSIQQQSHQQDQEQLQQPSPSGRRFPLFMISEHAQQQQKQKQQQARSKHAAADPPVDRNKLRTRASHENPASMPGALCVETDAGGRQRVYRIHSGVDKANGKAWEGFDMVDDPQTHQGRLLALVRSYLLPQGFPDSVAPQYASYMTWRGVQYFFGGAMSVFTTKCLLTSLGVAGRHSGEAAAAINWVLKDGAGRLGRFLFARWGRELDCELKQFRLAGDLLMEAGAALELSTILAPHAFLPLACSANLAKNLAAVAASSTRAPIYRTFALQNNLADITAKGESVANLADILGTLAGILLSKWRLPMVPTFIVLSGGYLLASRKEVDSVELPYLNRARLAFTATRFLATGSVPGVPEANRHEPLLPWGRYHQGRVVLGSRVEAACAAPTDLHHAAQLYKGERFVLCYRPDNKKVHVLLRQGATPTDCLKAAFSAHVFLHMLDEEQKQSQQKQQPASPAVGSSSSSTAGLSYSTAASSQDYSKPSTFSSSSGSSDSSSSSGSSRRRPRWRLFGSNKEQPAATEAAAAPAPAAAQPTLTGADLVRATWNKLAIALPWGQDPGSDYYRRLLERSKCAVDSLYSDFSRQAEKQGWKLASTMLNPKEARLMRLTPLTA